MPDRPKRSKRTADLPNKVVPIHEGAEPLRASLDDTDRAIVRALQANARATAGWRGRRAAWLAIVGLATLLFNFYAVNTVIVGLHSYGGR